MSAVRSPNPAIADYVAIERPEALVALAQHGTIEFHTWGARLPKLTHPDRLILDLDPDAAIGWPALIDAALLTRTLLHELTLPALLKTTGGKGLHVVVPLKPARGWDEIRPFARALAQRLAQVAPERFTATATKTRRTGKIFVDYLRNGEGATFVAAYSLRAREGAPVAMPIDWDELQPKRDLRGDCFNIGNALARAATSAQALGHCEAARRDHHARDDATGRYRGIGGGRGDERDDERGGQPGLSGEPAPRMRRERRASGAPGGTRTHDPWLRRPVLYPLSYRRPLEGREYRIAPLYFAPSAAASTAAPATAKRSHHVR